MTEERLLEAVRTAWSCELGQASLHATWHDAGGDSIRIMSFLLELEKILGRRLPLGPLSKEMTPSSLARDLAIAIQLDAEGSRPTTQSAPVVFHIPWLGGNGQESARFRAQLKGKVNFVVVRHPSWHEIIERDGNFDAIVSAAIKQILASEIGSGPYLLAGESSGGFVAWEAARRLLELGHHVGFVGLLDTCHPNLMSNFSAHRGLPQRMKEFFRSLWDMGPKSALLRLTIDPLVERSPSWILNAVCSALELMPARATRRLNPRLDLRLRYRALGKFVAPPLQMPIFLFRSGELLSESLDFGWKTLCPQLIIVHIGGKHQLVHEQESRDILCEKFIECVTTASSGPNRMDNILKVHN